MSRLIYDCEIIRCIPPRGISVISLWETKEEYFKRFGDGFEYCAGWGNFEDMGISVIGVADLDSDYEEAFILNFCNGDERLKNPHAILEFQKLALNNKIFGFNSRAFDDHLCDAHGIAVETDFDLLELVRISAFGSPRWKDQPRGFCYSLDAIARANGFAKSGSGELAPKLWQQGKHQEVIDYCLNDCKITRELILLFLERKLKDPNTGEFLGLEKS